MTNTQEKYQSILSSFKSRILFGIVSGFVFKIFIDIVFRLIYRNYDILKPLHTYIGVIIIAIIVVECFYRLSDYLNNKISWEDKTQKRFFIQFFSQAFIAILFFAIIRWIIEFLFMSRTFFVIKDEIIIITSTLIITLVFNLSDLGVFLLYKWRYSLAELERFKKENAEFKFETLRNQVNPHFLFNSLNTLSSIMYDDVEIAAKYIRQLSSVYRYVLENRQKELIDLEQELTFIESYKYLFELRFTNRLSININESCKNNYLIAPMTLQMLIENAVKHNIISERKPLKIDITCNNDYLRVENNLQKKAPEGYSSGMGLKNIYNRYEFLSQQEVKIIETNELFAVEIPLIKNN